MCADAGGGQQREGPPGAAARARGGSGRSRRAAGRRARRRFGVRRGVRRPGGVAAGQDRCDRPGLPAQHQLQVDKCRRSVSGGLCSFEGLLSRCGRPASLLYVDLGQSQLGAARSDRYRELLPVAAHADTLPHIRIRWAAPRSSGDRERRQRSPSGFVNVKVNGPSGTSIVTFPRTLPGAITALLNTADRTTDPSSPKVPTFSGGLLNSDAAGF